MIVAGYVYRKPQDLPEALPIFPLTGALLFPRGELPLNIFEPRYLNMIDDALTGHRLIGMIQPDGTLRGDQPGIARVGCVGKLVSYTETDDGRYLVTLKGISRFKVACELQVDTPYRQVKPDWHAYEGDLKPTGHVTGFDRAPLVEALTAYLTRNQLRTDWAMMDSVDGAQLVNALCALCPFPPLEKQALLEAQSSEARRDALIALMDMDRGDGAAHKDGDERPLQ